MSALEGLPPGLRVGVTRALGGGVAGLAELAEELVGAFQPQPGQPFRVEHEGPEHRLHLLEHIDAPRRVGDRLRPIEQGARFRSGGVEVTREARGGQRLVDGAELDGRGTGILQRRARVFEVTDASGEDDLLIGRGRVELADTHVVKNVARVGDLLAGSPVRSPAVARAARVDRDAQDVVDVLELNMDGTAAHERLQRLEPRVRFIEAALVDQRAREVGVGTEYGEVVGEALDRVLEHQQRVFPATDMSKLIGLLLSELAQISHDVELIGPRPRGSIRRTAY